MKLIVIGKRLQFQTIVSDEDYDYLIQFLWTYAVSHRGGSLIYARRSIRSGGANITLLMHHVVLERTKKKRPSHLHTCDHEDGNSLNNQRENLNWKTPRQQMCHRRPVYPHSFWFPPEEIPF